MTTTTAQEEKQCQKEKLPIVKVTRVSELKFKLSVPTAGEIEHFGRSGSRKNGETKLSEDASRSFIECSDEEEM